MQNASTPSLSAHNFCDGTTSTVTLSTSPYSSWTSLMSFSDCQISCYIPLMLCPQRSQKQFDGKTSFENSFKKQLLIVLGNKTLFQNSNMKNSFLIYSRQRYSNRQCIVQKFSTHFLNKFWKYEATCCLKVAF